MKNTVFKNFLLWENATTCALIITFKTRLALTCNSCTYIKIILNLSEVLGVLSRSQTVAFCSFGILLIHDRRNISGFKNKAPNRSKQLLQVLISFAVDHVLAGESNLPTTVSILKKF